MSTRKVAYYYDTDVGSYTYSLPHGPPHLMKPHRMRVTHELVTAYNMLPKMHILRPERATPEVMSSFHTNEYVHFLQRVTPETAEELTGHGTRFLVGDDNPPFEGVFEFCSISAGGSIAAANRIASGNADISINWAGGLHHAKKREASGFCYINDIVLGILELLRTYLRVLYIDIDIHHGDGVEEAFYTSDRVMTCSFHKFGDYFPGTGTQEDKGKGKGKGYSVNIPLKDGITDGSYKSIFEPVIAKILAVFQPSAVVLQCGADSVAGDKLGCFNLSMQGHAHCVQFLRQQNVPLILLGGGGYTVKNVARTWTYETACALGIEDTIDPVMPWNHYFEWFGPRYRLEVNENNMDDLNIKDGSLDKIRIAALEQLQGLQGAPSVGMHDVPRESVGAHLGFRKDDEESRDELDERLAQHSRYLYNLQDSDTLSEDTSSDESDDPSGSWKHSSRRVNKRHSAATNTRRMSILTGKYFDVPVREHGFSHYDHGVALMKSARRQFFQTSSNWEESVDQVLAGKGVSPLLTTLNLSGLMERGGQKPQDVGKEEWEDVDPPMQVDS